MSAKNGLRGHAAAGLMVHDPHSVLAAEFPTKPQKRPYSRTQPKALPSQPIIVDLGVHGPFWRFKRPCCSMPQLFWLTASTICWQPRHAPTMSQEMSRRASLKQPGTHSGTRRKSRERLVLEPTARKSMWARDIVSWQRRGWRPCWEGLPAGRIADFCN